MIRYLIEIHTDQLTLNVYMSWSKWLFMVHKKTAKLRCYQTCRILIRNVKYSCLQYYSMQISLTREKQKVPISKQPMKPMTLCFFDCKRTSVITSLTHVDLVRCKFIHDANFSQLLNVVLCCVLPFIKLYFWIETFLQHWINLLLQHLNRLLTIY